MIISVDAEKHNKIQHPFKIDPHLNKVGIQGIPPLHIKVCIGQAQLILC